LGRVQYRAGPEDSAGLRPNFGFCAICCLLHSSSCSASTVLLLFLLASYVFSRAGQQHADLFIFALLGAWTCFQFSSLYYCRMAVRRRLALRLTRFTVRR
jgi:hypothetical protein